jgi:hypothetical protein
MKTLAIVLVAGMLLTGSALAGPGGHNSSGEPDIPNIVAPAAHSTAVAPETERGGNAAAASDVKAVERRDAWLLKRVLWSFFERMHFFVAR